LILFRKQENIMSNLSTR